MQDFLRVVLLICNTSLMGMYFCHSRPAAAGGIQDIA